ncbi:ExbD/TolR family protein [Marinobacterium aestuariivivens]|uniref:ExbD/TolR family protein n=1 Tax=Marinobacterium aestuariivivens TaxID=1698799 RepID=A0ABW1ZXC2_9GAMM
MKIALTQNRSRPAGDDNLIPLINVVFLMLIFFMVAGQISRSDALRILPPASISETRTADENRALVLIADKLLYLDDEAVTLDSLGDSLARKFEQAEVPEDFSVLVKAEASTPVDELQAVLRQIRSAGLMKVSLATRLRGESA